MTLLQSIARCFTPRFGAAAVRCFTTRTLISQDKCASVVARSYLGKYGNLPEASSSISDLPDTIEEGFCIQRLVVSQLSGVDPDRFSVSGWKVGATSSKAQQTLGISTPFAGVVASSHLMHSNAGMGVGEGNSKTDLLEYPPSLRTERIKGVEAEFCYLIARDIEPRLDDPYTKEEMLEYVKSAHPSIEVAAVRFADDIPIELLVADMGGNGGLVVGEAFPSSDIPRGTSVTISKNGAAVATGSSDDILDAHPLEALAWLSNFLSRNGVTIRAGQYVATGTCTGLLPVASGDVVSASFEGAPQPVVLRIS